MATEKRLIDANKLIEALPIVTEDKQITLYGAVADFMVMISAMPTEDAVEVVRCKDCKHYDNSEGIQWCKLNSKFYPGGFDWHSFPEDGFCSCGERSTDAD